MVRRKGNAVDVIVWQTGTARLLPRLIAGRTGSGAAGGPVRSARSSTRSSWGYGRAVAVASARASTAVSSRPRTWAAGVSSTTVTPNLW